MAESDSAPGDVVGAPLRDPLSADAVLFDLDGVITPTAELHMHAWAEMFAALFEAQGVTEPYTEQDYFEHLDGRKRYDGVAAVLDSRHIELPFGSPDDAAELDTVCGVGNRKNDVFFALLARDGIAAYPGSQRFLDVLAERGVPAALVSSSKNAGAVLEAAGLSTRFPVIVDGAVAEREHIPSKPRPEMYLVAAERLGVAPGRAVVVEDAISGVQSGAAGDFGLVIGVDRGAGESALRAAGAHIVVRDLAELLDDASASTPSQEPK